MDTLALVNQKGGVGKTTVTLGFAAVAAADGRSVVVVDLDPQANATTGLGVWSPTGTVDDALAADRPGALSDVIRDSGWDDPLHDITVRVAPASPALAPREHDLLRDPIGAQDRLATALEGVEADLVLIDCPPSLGLLTVNALFAADSAVIVTEPAAWAVDGVHQITANIERIAQRRGGAPAIGGVVVNRLARTRDSRYWHDQLLDTAPERIIDPPIRHRAAVAEASAASLPITSLHRSGVVDAVGELRDALARIAPPRDRTEGVTDAAV